MTDLDFDELDKAVNTLMSGVDTSKRLPGADDPAENVIAIEPSGADTDQLATSAAAVGQAGGATAATPTADTSQPAVPLAAKRRGQFMDIMAPTSKPAPAPVSRQAPIVQPVTTSASSLSENDLGATGTNDPEPKAENISSDEPASSSDMPTPDVLSVDMESTGTASVPEDSHMTQEPTAISDDTHDDAPSQTSQDNAADLEATKAEVEAFAANDDTASQADDRSTAEADLPQVSTADQPLESPFLPDAKVDKRPLGAYPGAMPDPIDMATPDSDQNQPSDAHVASEASQDAIEGESVHETVAPSSSEATTAAAEVENETATSLDEQLANTDTDTTSAQPAAGGSIAQQYAEQPSSGDQTNGAIYDTATYHKAVDAPAPHKKASIWTWIIWALVLTTVGAAGGAAYFYFLR